MGKLLLFDLNKKPPLKSDGLQLQNIKIGKRKTPLLLEVFLFKIVAVFVPMKLSFQDSGQAALPLGMQSYWKMVQYPVLLHKLPEH